jgi:hypothetical protein
MAPYLGDPDYETAIEQLKEAFATGDPAQIKAVCRHLMYDHLSRIAGRFDVIPARPQAFAPRGEYAVGGRPEEPRSAARVEPQESGRAHQINPAPFGAGKLI